MTTRTDETPRRKPFGRRRACGPVPCDDCGDTIAPEAKRIRGRCQRCYTRWFRDNQKCCSVHNPTGLPRLPDRADAVRAAKDGWRTRRARSDP